MSTSGIDPELHVKPRISSSNLNRFLAIVLVAVLVGIQYFMVQHSAVLAELHRSAM